LESRYFTVAVEGKSESTDWKWNNRSTR